MRAISQEVTVTAHDESVDAELAVTCYLTGGYHPAILDPAEFAHPTEYPDLEVTKVVRGDTLEDLTSDAALLERLQDSDDVYEQATRAAAPAEKY